jgi:hypothetical protein
MVVESKALSEADFDRLVAMMTATSSFHGLSNALFTARGRKVAA